MRHGIIALFAGCAALLAAPPARAASNWDLAAAWRGAQRTLPAFRGADAAVAVARARVEVAKTGWMPTLQAAFSGNETTANFVAKPGALPKDLVRASAPTSMELWTFWQGSVAAQWTVTDFGRTAARVEAAREQAAAELAGGLDLRRTVWLKLAVGYVAAWEAQERLALAQKAQELAGLRVELAQQRVRARIQPSADLSRAQSVLAVSQLDVAEAGTRLRRARLQLAAWTGDSEAMAAAKLDAIAEVADLAEAGTPSVDDWLKVARDADPRLAQLAARKRAVLAELDAQRREGLPSLYVGSAVSLAGQHIASQTLNALVTAGASWEASQLWVAAPAVQKARAEIRLLDAQAEEIAFEQQVALQEALSDLQQGEQQRAFLQSARTAATRAAQQADERYESSLASLSEVLDAAAVQADVEARALQVEVKASLARLRWRAVVGRIDAP